MRMQIRAHRGSVLAMAIVGALALSVTPSHAATCPAPPYDDLAGVEIYCSFMKAVDDANIMNECGTRRFCPLELVLREDMAVFLEEGLEIKWPGTQHEIGAPEGLFSNDVPVTYGLARWIDQFKRDGITSGCDTLKFCPHHFVTRGEMAVFLSRTMTWTPSGFLPIPDSGVVPGNPARPYNCVPGPQGQTAFPTDVPPTHWACKFIHYIAVQGVTTGCEPTSYCPEEYTPRWQMAVFVSRVFGL